MKFIRFAAVGRRGEHYQMLPRLVRDIRDQRVPLLLSLGRPNRSGTGMDLVNNDQFRAFIDTVDVFLSDLNEAPEIQKLLADERGFGTFVPHLRKSFRRDRVEQCQLELAESLAKVED